MKRVDESVSLGTKVIVRSNENEPLMFGILVDWFDGEGRFSEKIPVVLVGDKRYFACGIVVVYTPEIAEELSSFNPKQQWELMKIKAIGIDAKP